MNLRILQANTGKRHTPHRLALWGSSGYDVVSVQEPAKNGLTGAPLGSGGSSYKMAGYKGEVAVYVHSRHSTGDWAVTLGDNWVGVRFSTGIEVISIYSPVHTRKGDGPLCNIPEAAANTRRVLIGDFNTHHPLWDRHNRTSPNSSDAIALAERDRCVLLTPRGVGTRFARGTRDGTIDLAWADESLPAQWGGPDLGIIGSDHIAQRILIGLDADGQGRQETAPPPQKFSWRRINKEAAAAEAAVRLRGGEGPMQTVQELETRAEWLEANLLRIALETVPRRKPREDKPAPRAAWWTHEVGTALKAAKKARRKYRSSPQERTWEDYNAAKAVLDKAVQGARREEWRAAVHEASQDQRKLWNLERWARLRSRAPPTLPHLPALSRTEGGPETARTAGDKAAMLGEKFFPAERPTAPVQDRRGLEHRMSPEVTLEEIRSAIRNTSSWKASGPDGIPAGLIKACGDPAARAIRAIAEASMRLGHYPARYRAAEVVVLQKPGKPPETLRTPKGWRPISLLGVVGKVIERAAATRIALVAEEAGLLPELQMGNRKGRSTETALKVVTSTIREAWARGGMASMLQLDIQGAFDSVPHGRLVDVMASIGFPGWMTRWIKAFLEDRSARLRVDGTLSPPTRIRAGVPQGSPLSPILYILYAAELYERLTTVPGIVTVGFADDTTIIAVGYEPEETRRRLENAWKECEGWAQEAGMKFAPEKSALTHFTRSRNLPPTAIRLGNATITPRATTTLLGVVLDRKLKGKDHVKHLVSKLKRQTVALTGIAAGAWGITIGRAREVYTKVIRSALAYGASAYMDTTTAVEKESTQIQRLAVAQSACLRVVTGAYRATPTHILETEAATPPLDLYLRERVAGFEARIQRTGMAARIRDAVAPVAAILRKRMRSRGPQSRVAPQARAGEIPSAGTMKWAAAAGGPAWEGGEISPKELRTITLQWWKARWGRKEAAAAAKREERRTHCYAHAAAIRPEFDPKKVMSRHEGLRKHESSVLTQLRTGKIGLNGFLYHRRVPEVDSPLCQCGEAIEDFGHMITECSNYSRPGGALVSVRTRSDAVYALTEKAPARAATLWLLSTGRLQHYELAREIKARTTGQVRSENGTKEVRPG